MFRLNVLGCATCAVAAGTDVGGNLDDEFWSLGVADQLGVADDVAVAVDGAVPSWLQGQYVLGGPSRFSWGKRKLNHLFDGFARISSFRFDGSSSLRFSSRMLDSRWYNDSAVAADVTPQFLMNATTPRRASDELPLLNALAPNDNNIVMPLRMNASTWWYLSDSETRLQFDPRSLRVTRELHASTPTSASDYAGNAEPKGYRCTISTAHGLFDQGGRGDLINQMGCSSSDPLPPLPGHKKKPDLVVVYRMARADPTRRVAIASFTPVSGVASYMHSFGLTDSHAVFVEQAIGFDMGEMAKGKSMIEGMPVNYSMPTFFHAVPLAGGDIVTVRSPFSFTFNHVANTVHDTAADELVLDIAEVFRSTHLMVGGAFDIWLNKTRRDTEINFEAMRFRIPLGSNISNISKSNNSSSSSSSSSSSARMASATVQGLLGRDVVEECRAKECDLIRLPRINPRFQGQPYCFLYGMQTRWGGGPFASQSVVKVDVCKHEIHDLGTHAPGQYPHELVFVPRPDGTAEDDGVLIGHLLDGPNNASSLQIIDARTKLQVARARLPLRLGEMIHGDFFMDE